MCHSCNSTRLNCRTCGERLRSSRNSEAEELSATLVAMTGGNVEHSVLPHVGEVLINVTKVQKVGKGPLASYVFKYESMK